MNEKKARKKPLDPILMYKNICVVVFLQNISSNTLKIIIYYSFIA